ncbi:GTP-sensing pleiotropic transcriptional regulator CodY [Natroniella sulfidigena]|uniref:GTP-sensing pleiotropic transcriptional regulator CodY n=1 Tax=Natroniella sulfidigena TaxID=723921 RepID=UPI00200A1A41|nr:GTP-sensing pleiotropic transcriptional regulator CodY [Natroniella sulfidigena]MCK8817436.1 GTP-sensing pleiotropic transcriptional regulator CodY [Natroniella sulfidigena]
MEKLITKTRRINDLIQHCGREAIDFEKMARVLSNCIGANVYIIDDEGKILGSQLRNKFSCELMKEEVVEKGQFPQEYNQWLLENYHMLTNYEERDNLCSFKDERCCFKKKLITITPINGAQKRLGTLIISRFDEKFDDSQLLLAEYGATVVGMEILRLSKKKSEKEARQKTAVNIALRSLSHLELEAVGHVFEKLDGEEGLLVTSKIADKMGIARSIIVNGLRKLESADVIESRSLGMKGTYIKVLNDKILNKISA